MKIVSIRDYIQPSQAAFCSPRNIYGNMSNVNNPTYYNTSILSLNTPQIRAIKADNLQIAASVTAGLGVCYVRGTPLFSGPVASSIIEFSFNAQKEPINILVSNYNINNVSEDTAFRNKLITLTNYFVVIITIGQNISSETVNRLGTMGDWFVDEGSSKVYCAVGYNNKIIDSISEPVIAELFVNGQSAFINTPTYNGSYYNFLLSGQEDIDYIVTKHHSSDKNFIIRDHAISVSTLEKNVFIKTPSNYYSESKYGSRYYLFDTISNDTIITGGFLTSVSKSLREASRRRSGVASASNFIYGKKLETTDLPAILSSITSFNRRYSNPSITDNRGTFGKNDIITVIREAEGIKLNQATCSGSSCSYNCRTNCDVLCVSSCGIQCSGSCLNQCSSKCGYYNCNNNCGASCISGCEYGCNTTCSSDCRLSCGVSSCSAQCYNTCNNGCKYGCVGTCLGICLGNCGTTCGTSCGTNCTGNCDMNCHTGCRNDDNSSSSCYDCWGVCRDGGCDNGCRYSCIGSCDSGCKNKCYGVCSAGGCSNTCTGSCSIACARGCGSGCQGKCENLCTGGCEHTCSLTCGQGCQVMCENGCSGNCSSSCSFSCFAAEGSVYV